ncbi:NUDIX hydrolase [Candidatus Peregrinibacteria bacterium]|jgi:8-oxo-dGTP diphosphatase|nr:NUDIX hydrolase [Candidatus Peregrinibacteria bacterium]MBT3598226.1 NUDIX hydrolase [Candidatus Peregrinibacteria bacterium]MBT4367148.1 NUDIX hydrolase [Candidatus Peregrinibacteria bacterium]MBT4585806.1 NUDIX hydrolase [Candidatus Peregrinibacteria bacterium]MBT6730934.1 NUDIX hydrolase [Candidatus Peregrinibacteria bacterium]
MKINNHLLEVIEKLEKNALIDGIQKLVVGAAISDGDKILILIRSDNDSFLAGYAEIPGGGVEKEQGETIIEALERETKEETGLNIDRVIDYIGSFDYMSESGKKTRQLNFLLETDSSKIILDSDMEHSDHVWCRPDDTKILNSLTMSNKMRKVIRDISIYNRK